MHRSSVPPEQIVDEFVWVGFLQLHPSHQFPVAVHILHPVHLMLKLALHHLDLFDLLLLQFLPNCALLHRLLPTVAGRYLLLAPWVCYLSSDTSGEGS